MKQQKKLLILCGILVVFLGIYYGATVYTETKEAEALEAATLEELENTIYVTEIDSSSIVGVSWSTSTSEVTLELDGEEWKYTEDTTVPIDSYYPELVASTFSTLVAVRELTDFEELASYGLEDASYTVTLTDDTGTTTTYYIGDYASENYYLATDDKSTVYTVSSSTVSAISYYITDIVELDTFSAPSSEELDTVTIMVGEEETIYTVDDEGVFDTIAGGLSVLTLTDCIYINVSDDPESFGLDEAQRTTWTMVYGVAIESEDTTEESTEEVVVEMEMYEETLYIGSYIDLYDTYYLQVEGSNIVYSVASDTIEMLLNEYVETDDSTDDSSIDISSYFY